MDVCMMLPGSDFLHIQSTFQHMGEALKRSTYMMMIVTEGFCTDKWAEVQRDETLMASIKDPNKRWSV